MALAHVSSSDLKLRRSDGRGIGCGGSPLIEAVGWIDGMEDGLSHAGVIGDGRCGEVPLTTVTLALTVAVAERA